MALKNDVIQLPEHCRQVRPLPQRGCWRSYALLTASLLAIAGCAGRPSALNPADPTVQVFAVEQAFADTMAQRDHEAFKAFLADDTVFFSGESALRGKAAVADHWAKYFVADRAPFSWAPESVEVLDRGDLALSTGPVWGGDGQRIATFTSIWRRGPQGWQVVFDRGSPYCPAQSR